MQFYVILYACVLCTYCQFAYFHMFMFVLDGFNLANIFTLCTSYLLCVEFYNIQWSSSYGFSVSVTNFWIVSICSVGVITFQFLLKFQHKSLRAALISITRRLLSRNRSSAQFSSHCAVVAQQVILSCWLSWYIGYITFSSAEAWLDSGRACHIMIIINARHHKQYSQPRLHLNIKLWRCSYSPKGTIISLLYCYTWL